MKPNDTAIPRSVLSQAFADRMSNRRLVSAVFTTFKFDPRFFQDHILPVFFDIPFSPVSAIRCKQLEDELHELRGHVAVYYDQNGIDAESGGLRVNVKRYPVRMLNGAIFHTKNVFALVEDETPDDDGYHARTLLVACLSANLTQAGWWENVEVCHIEEVRENEKSWLKDGLLACLEKIREMVKFAEPQPALEDIQAFLRNPNIGQRQRASGDLLPTRLYYGQSSLSEFLHNAAGDYLRKTHLEIISPYFDGSDNSPPLKALKQTFEPKTILISLPRGRQQEATCSEKLYRHIEKDPDVTWAHLPNDLLRSGRATDATPRFVHAKVYRFYLERPRREVLFVGSANLTDAAHNGGGNYESGFLVEVPSSKRPEAWLTPEETRPKRFTNQTEAENIAATGGTKLRLRYHWDTKVAKIYWDDDEPSPALKVKAQGEPVFAKKSLPPRKLLSLSAEIARHIETILRGASLFSVSGEGEHDAVLLVQEEGMHCRPSILQDLSIADILRSWAILTREQRAAFIEARGQELLDAGEDAGLTIKTAIVHEKNSMFDQFAGFFHAFACINRKVREDLDDKTSSDKRKAIALLFGAKYDSLTPLLERLRLPTEGHDAVDRYVIAMCARQLCDELRNDYPEFWREHRAEVTALEKHLETALATRAEIVGQNGPEMEHFLDWFDKYFLCRAKPREEQAP